MTERSAILARAARTIARRFDALASQGIKPGLDGAQAKRIRLTNAVSLFGAFVMVASLPFDWTVAPRWMLAEDVLGAVVYLALPLVNRGGRHRLGRFLLVALSNLIVLGNAVLLGPESDAQMVFIALAALPFVLFDLAEWPSIAAGALLSLLGFALAHIGWLAAWQSTPPDYSPHAYRLYSALVAFAGLLFIQTQASLANARAERSLRENRSQAIQAAKMAALGEMSGNIAHEINNPLAAILLRIQRLSRLAERDGADAAAIAHTARNIETTVHRLRRIVDALRSFAREMPDEPSRPESVLAIVNDTVELCRQRFRQHAIDLVVGPISPALAAECRAVQISQILLNLLSNAHDAVESLPEGAGSGARWVRIACEADDREVRISVTDSGPGIPPEIETRIMEPFFTTKEVGKGTGLGLSLSKGLAEAHGGGLIHDASSSHTRFVIRLPRGVLPASEAHEAADAPARPSG